MKYLVIEFQQNNEDNLTHLVTVHDSLDEAESKYHLILSYAAVSDLPLHSAAILTPDGFTQKCQVYRHENN